MRKKYEIDPNKSSPLKGKIVVEEEHEDLTRLFCYTAYSIRENENECILCILQ